MCFLVIGASIGQVQHPGAKNTLDIAACIITQNVFEQALSGGQENMATACCRSSSKSTSIQRQAEISKAEK